MTPELMPEVKKGETLLGDGGCGRVGAGGKGGPRGFLCWTLHVPRSPGIRLCYVNLAGKQPAAGHASTGYG